MFITALDWLLLDVKTIANDIKTKLFVSVIQSLRNSCRIEQHA
jgi:hypothetical protein